MAAAALALASCGGSSRTHRPSRLPFPQRIGRAGCSTAVASARPLAARTSFLGTSRPPFGVAVTPDGRFSFVDEVGGHVAVFSDAGFRPTLVRTIALPGDAVGNSLTPDGRYLLIADGGGGATVVDVQRAETSSQHVVLGALSSGPHGGFGGAIEVTSSADGRYAFVSLEGPGTIAVYDLHAALAGAFKRSSYVGAIRVGNAPVGLALSPDSHWLYSTSEIGTNMAQGTLSVINVATAEHDPVGAVTATVAANCSPVRVVASHDGGTVWVTARESNQLLAFSATKLRSDPAHALLAAVRVGEAPVGLALIHGGHDVVVADSNRFRAAGAGAQLTVVDTASALAHRPAVVGTIRSGLFPREMALEPDGNTLLVGNFGSDQLEAVGVSALP